MAEKKKTAFEKVQDNRKELVNKVIENMEKGYVWEAGWDINALRSQNPVSGAKYKGINRISLGYIITENGYKDPRFITFKQAQDNNWKVKRGEHGYLCEYWVWTKKEEKVNEKGEKEKIEVPLERPIINYFTIFNMEQIEGNYPKFELPKLSHDEMLQVANDFIASSRCTIKETAQDRAYYSPSEDHIVLPLRDSFKSTEDFLETTLHEMAHSTGKELGRKFGITPSEYAREELVAELSSMFIKADLGIDFGGKHFENHSAYLESWAGMLKKDPNELYRASKEADKVTELLIERYKDFLKTKENITEKIEIQKEDNKEIINANEYWRIEFNETDSAFGIKSYQNQVLTKELLDEIRELDKKMYDELGALKFYFEHIKDGEIIDKGRINVGSNEKENFEYLANELEKLEKTNNLVKENDSLKGLKLTLNFSEHDFGISDETTLVGKEAYDLLQKIIDLDKEQNKVQKIINKEIEEGRFDTEGPMYYKTYISLSHNDIPILENTRIDLGDLEFGKEKEVGKALEEYLTKIPKNRLEYPVEYVENCKKHSNKEITPEEVISENKEKLKNINGLIFDLKKYEIEKDISEMKNINKFNENGNKQGVWFEVGENSILECKYNNGAKIGKFTETYLMADENSPIKTQGMYRVGKLSGEIVSLYSNDEIHSIKNYKAGVLLTEENYYNNGNIKEIAGYDKGNCVEFKRFYENGNLRESLEFLNKDEKNYKTYSFEGNIEKNITLYTDRDKVLSMVQKNGENFEKADFSLRADKEIALTAIKNSTFAFDIVPIELKENKEFMMKACEINGNNLSYARSNLLNDKDVIMTAVKDNGLAIRYAFEDVKKDREVILEALNNNGNSFKYIPEELKNDRDLVMTAVKSRGYALGFVPETFQNDKEIVLESVRQNGNTLGYASPEIRDNKEIVKEAVKNYGEALQYASKPLKADKEVILEAIKENGIALKWTPDEIRNNKEIVKEAVKNNGWALMYASPELKNNKEIVMTAIKNNSGALQFASPELKNNKKIVLEAVKNNGMAILNASKELQKDKEIVKEAVKEDKNVFKYLTREVTDKYSTVEKLLENEKENDNSWEDKLNDNSSDLER